MNSQQPQSFYLPVMLAKWPWSRVRSDHYSESKAESCAWIESFNPFTERGLKAFHKCDFSLLSSLTYSPREKEFIRLGCDLMHLFFVFDEYTDVEDRAGALRAYENCKDAFDNPTRPRPQGEGCLAEIVRDFWLRAQAYVAPNAACLDNFLDTWDTYTTAVVQEAEDRSKNNYRSFEDYLTLRRYTAGGNATLALTEFGLDLPDEVYRHPVMCSLREKAEYLIALINDVYSYVREKSRNLVIHNSVEIVRLEQQISTQEAIYWVADYCDEIIEGFLADLSAIPSWGPDVDKRVAIYVNGLGQWVRGMDDWHFEGGRYFGSDGPTIQQTRIATLRPPSHGYVVPREQDGQLDLDVCTCTKRPLADTAETGAQMRRIIF